MLKIARSSRENPSEFICEGCGKSLVAAIHQDFMELYCAQCGHAYYFKRNQAYYNCCCPMDNELLGKAALAWKRARDKWLPLIKGENGMAYMLIAQQELASTDSALEALITKNLETD
jgi:hypothetical protein